MRILALLPLLLLPATVSADGPAQVDGVPGAVIKYRQAGFSGMARHMKSLGLVAKGKVKIPQADMVAHAKGLQAMGPAIHGWFPKGTGAESGVETEALPAIWSDAAGFEKAVKDYEAATTELVAKAEAGDADAFVAAFKGVGKTCGGCHDTFRKDDD